MPASLSFPSPLVAAVTGAALPAEQLSQPQELRLLQELRLVPDPRRRRGRRHSLQSILLIAVSAVLAGARSFAAIGDWSTTTRPALGVCGRPPHAATIRRLLIGVDPVAVEAAVTRWALTCNARRAADLERAGGPRNERRQVLAVDGKNVRGARQADDQQIKLVCVVDHTHKLVLTQTEVVGGN